MPVTSHTVAAVVRPVTQSSLTKKAGGDETDAGDDFRSNTRGIEDDPACREYVCEPVLGDKQKQSGCHAHESAGADAGTLVIDLALQLDGGGEQECCTEPTDLAKSLSTSVKQRQDPATRSGGGGGEAQLRSASFEANPQQRPLSAEEERPLPGSGRA